ncbi:MAG: YdcF family protein [Bacteroidota bacterium]
MFFAASKALTFLLQPLLWTFVLVALAFLIRRGKYRKPLLITAIAVLYFFSNVFIVDEFSRAWEIPEVKDEQLRNYNTAVVLGGMSSWDPQFKRTRFLESGDRLMQTIRLYKEGKVKRILISGGSGSVEHPEDREAEFIRDYLRKIGMLDPNFYFESNSRNTHENALFSKSILDGLGEKDTIVLVTSAFHMRRAQACFDKVGIKTIAYATDHHTGDRKFNIDHLLVPDNEAQKKWNILLKEWIGMATYKMKGWI